MVNWYYVVGSERLGPVSVEALKQLFLNDEISLETYVWKKGFPSWERLKDVGELKFNIADNLDEAKNQEFSASIALSESPSLASRAMPAPVETAKASSPEVIFSFDWKKIKEKEEIFFVRIGKDRKNFEGSDIYGPYSMEEIREAMNEKRINFQTLIFAPGMSSWTRCQDTPLNENYKGINQTVGLNEIPLLMVFDYSPLPLVTVVKKSGTKEGVLLGSGPFVELKNKTVMASLYIGSEIKIKNVQVKVQSYDTKEQRIECQFLDMNQDAKKIMLNHAV